MYNVRIMTLNTVNQLRTVSINSALENIQRASSAEIAEYHRQSPTEHRNRFAELQDRFTLTELLVVLVFDNLRTNHIEPMSRVMNGSVRITLARRRQRDLPLTIKKRIGVPPLPHDLTRKALHIACTTVTSQLPKWFFQDPDNFYGKISTYLFTDSISIRIEPLPSPEFRVETIFSLD
jgi:hypothetical protein